MTSITLPKPPSLNHIYGYTSRGGFARSYITDDGKRWFQTAIQQIASIFPITNMPIAEPVRVMITLYTARSQDVDNILKPTLDVLASYCRDCHTKYSVKKSCICGKKWGALQDDKHVFELTVRKVKVPHVEDEHLVLELDKMDNLI